MFDLKRRAQQFEFEFDCRSLSGSVCATLLVHGMPACLPALHLDWNLSAAGSATTLTTLHSEDEIGFLAKMSLPPSLRPRPQVRERDGQWRESGKTRRS